MKNKTNMSKLTFNKNRILLLFLLSLFILSSFGSKECAKWYEICSQFQLSLSKTKSCYGQTLFFYSDFQSDWESARTYCSSIFQGYQRADVLYFDDENDPDPDLKTFMDNLQSKVTDFPTSALCCPMIKKHDDRHQIYTTVQCKWLYNEKEIDRLHQNFSVYNTTQCRFLTVDLSDPEKPKFTRAIQVSSLEDFQFICTYKKPTNCDDNTTITKLPVTTLKTKKPTPSTIMPTTTKSYTKYCLPIYKKYGINYWPPTPIFGTSEPSCPETFHGKASWKCGANGKFVQEGPFINCTRLWIDSVAKKIDNTKNMKELSTEIKHFKGKMEKEPAAFPSDLEQIIKIIYKIDYIFNFFASNPNAKLQSQDVRSITESMVESCSNMVGSEQAWHMSNRQSRVTIAGKILNYIQYSGITLGCYAAKNEPTSQMEQISLKNSNIYLNFFNMDHDQPIRFSHSDYSFSMKKSLYTNEDISDWCPHRIGVGALFKKLSSYMFDEDKEKDLLMNSDIIAFNYNNITQEIFILPNNNEAQISLKHHHRIDFGSKTKCVFWDYKTESWSSNGCYVQAQKSNRNQTTCICNHLTNFAVLMDVSGREKPSQLKSILTIIMCSISLICLILTIIFFTICRELKSRRNSIILNISMLMIIIDLLIIFGLDRTNYPILCKLVSIALLYSMLALFFWMLMEGYNLYQMMILIFNTKGRLRMLYLYLIGYGTPLLITIAGSTYMYLQTELTNEYFCWITSTKYPGQIWILAGPVTLIIIINTMIMVRVMKIVLSKNVRNSNSSFHSTMINVNGIKSNGNLRNNIVNINTAKHRKSSKNTNSYQPNMYLNVNDEQKSPDQPCLEERMSEWFSYLKGFFGLIVLMGITWITYILYIHQFGHYFAYVFIVMNGLQGVFIFITQFLFNKKAINAVKRRIYRLVGYDDYSQSSSTRNATTTSYLSQQKIRFSNGNNNLRQQMSKRPKNDDFEDDPYPIVSFNRYPCDLLINRTTSMEF